MDKISTAELFASPEGERLYGEFLDAVRTNRMRPFIERGSLIGLSGGADSVMLTLLLLEYVRREGIAAKLLAVHINHGIRGDEADRDERAAGELAEALGVEFTSRKIDVPALADKTGKSIEEAARDARYAAFSDIISGRSDISSIALGHNATDNLETVIFNMMRGAGSRGASGIPPTRGNIYRPMLYIPKADIERLLLEGGIPFVTDSTNKDTAYTRNYIRHEIIPRLSRLSPSPEAAITRLTQNLRIDGDYIFSVAEEFLRTHGESPRSAELVALHPAVLARVICEMARRVSGKTPERTHLAELAELLGRGESFSLSLPGGCVFESSCGISRVRAKDTRGEISIPLIFGENPLPEYSASVDFFEAGAEISHNVYNFSIQVDISSAIIKGDLFIRSRRDGDSYRYGGMTRSVKTLFTDAKIPRGDRHRVPVICDGAGILWIPGFGARDDGETDEKRYVRISFADYESPDGFYIQKQIRQKKRKAQ